MRIAIQVIFAFAAIACSAVVSHYIVLAARNPERFLAFLHKLHRDQINSMVYHALLMVGWGAAAYLAARGMLFWIPDGIGSSDDRADFGPLRQTLSAMVGFASLTLIGAVRTAAIDSVRRKELVAENRELLGLLEKPHNAWDKVTEFSEKLETRERPAYELLHDVAATFVSQLENRGFRKPETAGRKRKQKALTQAALVEAIKLRAREKAGVNAPDADK